jgi:hypothetical protein
VGSFKKLPKEVRNHLNSLPGIAEIIKNPGMEDLLGDSWMQKEKIFMDQVHSYGMRIEHHIPQDEKKAFLILTYSGSILGVGPEGRGKKHQVIYASIGFRKDVPEKLIEENLKIKNEVKIDREVEFSGGTLKKSSPVYKIAVMPGEIAPGDQTRQIEDATRVITQEFVSINNTIVPE